MSGGSVLALGSNLGDRLGHLQAGVALLADTVGVTAVSSVYESDPVGGPPQPAYLNAIVLSAEADPDRLRCAVRVAESARGRRRELRWGPRTLDVDVIELAGHRSADPTLVLPHPRAHLRAFVLLPWLELQPDAYLPGLGYLRDLARRVDRSAIRRRGELRLTGPR